MTQPFIPAVTPASHAGDLEALGHLKAALLAGAPWPQALLEAVALWTSPDEVYQGRRYQYLIAGEAFDWLLLAERLCAEVDGLIPQEDKERLLFHGQLPEEVSPREFRRLLGPAKYSAYLNYHYGVLVEEALLLAVEEEVRKRRRANGFAEGDDYSNEAFLRLYQAPQQVLLARFLQEKGYPRRAGLTFAQYRELLYWLFKGRLKTSDPAKVASDTTKGLRMLARLRGERAPGSNGRR